MGTRKNTCEDATPSSFAPIAEYGDVFVSRVIVLVGKAFCHSSLVFVSGMYTGRIVSSVYLEKPIWKDEATGQLKRGI